MRTSFFKNLKNLIWLSSSSLFLYSQAMGEDVRKKVRLVDRLSYTMTGQFASPATKNAFINGDKDLVTIAEELKTTELFKMRLTRYWTDALGIKSVAHFDNAAPPGSKTFHGEIVGVGMSAASRSLVYFGLPNQEKVYQAICNNKNGLPFTEAEELFYEQNCCT